MTTLSQAKIIGFIPSTDLEASLAFFKDTLGLLLTREDEYALEFDISGAKLRITKVAEFTPANYTILGWEIPDIESAVTALMKKGVHFEKFAGLPQNELCICSFPGGSKVAWLKDPDGNTLSLTQFTPL